MSAEVPPGKLLVHAQTFHDDTNPLYKADNYRLALLMAKSGRENSRDPSRAEPQ